MSLATGPVPLALRAAACLTLGLLLLPGDARSEESQEARNREPVPRIVAFRLASDSRLNVEARNQIDGVIQRTFSSLGDVSRGRDLIVRRFGVLAVPSLENILKRSTNETETWNAAMTVAALRDVEGGALELKACIGPLVTLADDRSQTPHLRGFCCLALGSFPWPEGVLPVRYQEMTDYYIAVPGPARMFKKGVKELEAARRVLLKRAADKLAFSSTSALLAIAKTGGDELFRGLLDAKDLTYANANPKRALLLTKAFLSWPDPRAFLGLDGLRNDESRIRSAAALGLAISMLLEDAPGWTKGDAPILKELKTANMHLVNDEEAVFARGVYAYKNQQDDEWRDLWTCATTPSTRRNCAAAACQMLIFCDQPWLRTEIVEWAKKPSEAFKHDALRGLVSLRAGEMGTPDALEPVYDWLSSKSMRPASNPRWDPRWYATIGLLRSLARGRLVGQAERRMAIETLRSALRRKVIAKGAAIRPVLERVLEDHGDRIVAPKESALYHLPVQALRDVENSFRCPYGLIAADPLEACVRRVNDMVLDIYGLDNLTKNKPGEVAQQPERYLLRYLREYPYFSRLEFFERRGFRDLPAYTEPTDLVIDR